jgi:DNA-binding NarL/FixJ family response regulator
VRGPMSCCSTSRCRACVGVLERLSELDAAARAIVFTVFDTNERIIAAVEAGAAGHLLKGAPRSDVFAAVHTVAAGGSLLAPAAASPCCGACAGIRATTRRR